MTERVDLAKLENVIKQALPMTMRNESPCEARVALRALIAELTELRAQAGGVIEPEADNWLPAKHTPPLPDTDVRFRVGGWFYVGRLVRSPFGEFMRAEEGDFALSIVSWQPLPTSPEATDG